MAIQHGIWKIGEPPQSLVPVRLDTESLLEEQICKDVSILNANWMLIGQQVATEFGKFIDLLAVNSNGHLIVIELKKHKTPRDVVAQTIDYAAWIETVESDRIVQIYHKFAEDRGLPLKDFDAAFEAKFGAKPVEEDLNSTHQMVVVAAELDSSTERIINYLNNANVAINAVFFSVFEDEGNQYLSRAWMLDPEETEDKAQNIGRKEDWNGEYYASFGAWDGGRSWEDACKHNFISAGDGRWYNKTLFKLSEGDRVWVNIPKTGYVGVAEVTASARIADEFIQPGMNLSGHYKLAEEEGEDAAEYFVPVKWLYDVSVEQAVSEVGLFGNQNSVAQPRTPKWTHTVERLKALWRID